MAYSPPRRRYESSRSPIRRSRSPARRNYNDEDAYNPGNNLYVTGLSMRVTVRDLEEFFSKEGKVSECHLVVDPRTKESRGFGFVTMDSMESAERCVKYLNKTIFEGRVVTVEKARRKRARTPTPGTYLGMKTRASSGFEGRRGYDDGYSSRRSPRGSPYPSRRSPRYSPYRSSREHSPYRSGSRHRSPSPYNNRRPGRSPSPYNNSKHRDRSLSPPRYRNRPSSPPPPPPRYRDGAAALSPARRDRPVSPRYRDRSASPRPSRYRSRTRSVSPRQMSRSVSPPLPPPPPPPRGGGRSSQSISPRRRIRSRSPQDSQTVMAGGGSHRSRHSSRSHSRS